MSPFLQFVQEMLPALSQMLAVYGFGIAFFLFISQTETYNRVAWFAKKADDHHVWVAIFNTSRRYLVKDQIYRILSSGKSLSAVCSTLQTMNVSADLLAALMEPVDGSD